MIQIKKDQQKPLASRGSAASSRPALHFAGFRDDRYWNAVRIWGEPDFIHETWDRYAADEVAPGDVVILAVDGWDRAPRSFSKGRGRN